LQVACTSADQLICKVLDGNTLKARLISSSYLQGAVMLC
jgi:hypothetical protein